MSKPQGTPSKFRELVMAPKWAPGQGTQSYHSLSAFDKVNKWLLASKALLASEDPSETSYSGHDAQFIRAMELIGVSVEPTKSNPHHCVAVFSMGVEPHMCNHSGNLHGGAAAAILDSCTSMGLAAISKEGFWDSGHVSRTLNCTYLRPVPGDGKVLIECEVVHAGKRLALLKGVIKREDGKTCVTCEHNKAAVGGSSL